MLATASQNFFASKKAAVCESRYAAKQQFVKAATFTTGGCMQSRATSMEEHPPSTIRIRKAADCTTPLLGSETSLLVGDSLRSACSAIAQAAESTHAPRKDVVPHCATSLSNKKSKKNVGKSWKPREQREARHTSIQIHV